MQTASSGPGPANLTILIRPEPTGQHTAQVVGLPEFRASAATAGEALEQVQRLMTQSLAMAQWAQVSVPGTVGVHPLQPFAGHNSDPTEFAEYQEEIHRYRQEVGASE